MNLDHDTFHALEIDALYDELDGPRAAEIHAHAASCESCSSRFERLRRARRRGLAALAEPVSHGFESRVMAAVDAALAGRAGGPALLPRPQHLHIVAERARSGGAAAPRPAARKPAAVAMNDPAPPPPMAAPSPAKSKPIGGASDGSLSAAKALYGAGRYSEACPTFEALRASSPEADLYAARCVLRVNGCSAAVPRLDGVASRHAGTDVGNRARADSEACTRAQASKNATPNAAATTGPGTPSGGGAAGRPSAPKAPAQEFDSK